MDGEENKEGQEQENKEGDKEKNFNALKTKFEADLAKEREEKEEMKKKLDDMDATIKTASATQKSDWKESAVASVVGNDAEKSKAVLAEYDILNMPDGTRAEVNARMLKALKLAGYELKGDVTSIPFGNGKDSEAKTDKVSKNSEAFLNGLFPNMKFDK